MKEAVVLFLSCILFSSGFAQKDSSYYRLDQTIKDNLENIASSAERELDYNTLLDQLNYYKEHPLDINTATREELEALGLLNPLQVEALVKHVHENGKLIALEEFQTIDGFDLETIYRLLPYVKLGGSSQQCKVTLRRLLEEGKSALFIRYQRVLEEPKGYTPKNFETGDTNRYLGNRGVVYTRYRYRLGNQISIGFTAQKDAGEEFFQRTQSSGFDFYSAHLFYRGKSWLKSFVVGDYHVQYGQGVTLGTGLSFGKSYDVMNIKKNERGFYPFTSVNENAFMRGAAVSIGGKKLLLDLFYSRHSIDANVSSRDTMTQEEIISAFQQSGNHRTYAELQDKHTLDQSMYGGHLQYKVRNLNIGFTGYCMMLDKGLFKAFHPYNQFEFSGNRSANVGMDYNYAFSNVNFFGEVARSENGGMAYLNGTLVSLDPRVGISLLHRHYDKDYQNLFSNGFSESSRNANEDGLFMGIFTKPLQSLTLSAYYDQFKFPWLRYLVSAPSVGDEYMVQLTYIPGKTFETYFRIRQKNKPTDQTGDSHPVSSLNDASRTNYRFHIRYKVSDAFTLSNRIELNTYKEGNSSSESGILIYQDVNYKPMGSRFSCALRYTIFDTDSYDTRIYAYENDVLYSYSIPFLYDSGSRFYTVLHYRIVRNVDCWLRYSITVYDNMKTIGTGLDEISGNKKSEIGAQLRFQF